MGGVLSSCCGWLFGEEAMEEEEGERLVRSTKKQTEMAMDRLRARSEKRAEAQRKTAVELESLRQSREET